MKLSVITTTDPVSGTLPDLLRELDVLGTRCGWTIEVLIVDDLKTAHPGAPQAVFLSSSVLDIRWLTYPDTRGQLEAIFFGIHQASGDIVVTIDPDMFRHVATIPRMLQIQQEKNKLIVHASRSDRPGLAWWRRAGSLIANRFVATLLSIKVADLGSPLTLFPRELIKELQMLPPKVSNPRLYIYGKHPSRIAEARLESPSPSHTSNYSLLALIFVFFRLLHDTLQARSLLRRRKPPKTEASTTP